MIQKGIRGRKRRQAPFHPGEGTRQRPEPGGREPEIKSVREEREDQFLPWRQIGLYPGQLPSSKPVVRESRKAFFCALFPH